MTKDDVTRMAHEAAGFDGTTSLTRPVILYAAMSKDFLDKFAKLVAAAEREACARLLENGRFLHDEAPAAILAKEAAKAIRKRGER